MHGTALSSFSLPALLPTSPALLLVPLLVAVIVSGFVRRHGHRLNHRDPTSLLLHLLSSVPISDRASLHRPSPCPFSASPFRPPNATDRPRLTSTPLPFPPPPSPPSVLPLQSPRPSAAVTPLLPLHLAAATYLFFCVLRRRRNRDAASLSSLFLPVSVGPLPLSSVRCCCRRNPPSPPSLPFFLPAVVSPPPLPTTVAASPLPSPSSSVGAGHRSAASIACLKPTVTPFPGFDLRQGEGMAGWEWIWEEDGLTGRWACWD